ncbi:MAG: diaminopimelate decarboxylase [Chloroflexi bacterium]|nr:diaminopimelate decarboxylase [Chloroflexota bacterium]
MVVLQGTQRVNNRGHLEVGGCDATELAAAFGTPLYVVDEVELRRRCRRYRQALHASYSNSSVAFAGKALLNLAIARIVAEENLELDVASGGELYTALQAGFPVQRITLHGNFKLDEELRLALRHGVGRIGIDSLDEIERLARLSEEMHCSPRVTLRVAPGVDPHTHGKISTGQDDTKFGLNISNGAARAGIQAILRHPHLQLAGFHCHVGSQLLDTEAHEAAADIVCRFAASMQERYGMRVQEIILGGGLGIQYLPGQQPPSIERFADSICDTFRRSCQNMGLGEPHLGVEPGRSIAGEAGLTLYTIGPVKRVPIREVPGERWYVAVDGGLSDNPRPLMYDALYQTLLANRAAEMPTITVRVSGRHCETDTLLPAVELPEPHPGDILAVLATGAYNASMASNYNRFPRPAMVLANEGNAELITRRETFEDLLKLDLIPERLRQKAIASQGCDKGE